MGDYFNQDLFASNIILPEQTIAAIGYTSPAPIDCTGYQGYRAKFINDIGASIADIVFTWYDDQAQALAPTAFNFAGQRAVVCGTGQEAAWSGAHLGDWLVISILSQDGGNFSLHTAVAHRQNPARQWLPGDSKIINFPTTSLANGTTIPTSSQINLQGIYAGPASVVVQGPSNAAGWQMFLQALGNTTGSWSTIWDSGLIVSGLAATGLVVIPPAPLRLDFHNNTGGAANFACAVVADDWRD